MAPKFRITGSRTIVAVNVLRADGATVLAMQFEPAEAEALALKLIRKADASRALAKLYPSQKPRKKRKARR